MFELAKEVGWKKLARAGLAEVKRKLWLEIIRGSFSQNYEDLIIDKIIGKNDGFYVEIGAYHPTRLSNTYRFYRKGWRGVVVEPNPEINKMFRKIRPSDRYVGTGIGKDGGEMKYYKYPISALNTFSKKQVKINAGKGYKYNKIEKIEIIGIRNFLKKYVKRKKIDVLSIDVEGWDDIILRNWDWKIKPKIICVESEGKMKVEFWLKRQGYKLAAKTKHNSILALED